MNFIDKNKLKNKQKLQRFLTGHLKEAVCFDLYFFLNYFIVHVFLFSPQEEH